ncbi:MAG: hypothetical protein SFU98_06195 [Leptospiraceae bacterium]|nr:hypothetical protein [Leptospiraceae bacterium]
MTRDPLLALLGSLLVASAIALVLSYEPYKFFIDPFMQILAIASFIFSVWIAFNEGKGKN